MTADYDKTLDEPGEREVCGVHGYYWPCPCCLQERLDQLEEGRRDERANP